MNSRALLIRPRGAQAGTLTLPCYEQQSTAEKTKRCPRLLVYSWFIPGALLVHSWCTPGALPVHFRCTSGALSVHSKGFPKGNVWIAFSLTYKPERELHPSERKPRSSAQKRLDRLFANLQTRKGIAPLPKGSLDPLHRNVWIAFSPTCKPERELPRFRKEASILRTETFGSHSVKARANDPPHENRLDRPRNYHIHH